MPQPPVALVYKQPEWILSIKSRYSLGDVGVGCVRVYMGHGVVQSSMWVSR